MTNVCPLCKSKDSKIIDEIDIASLKKKYIRFLGESIHDEFISATSNIVVNTCSKCNLIFFSPTLLGGEPLYSVLQKRSWYYLSEKQEYTYAASCIPAKSRVLEIGCGKGAFANYLKDCSFVGIELSASAVSEAQKTGLAVTKDDIYPFSDEHAGEFDVVCSFQVLEHVEECGDFISAQLKCLKPGGLLIQAVPSYDTFLRYSYNNLLNMPPHHQTLWTDECLFNLAKVFDLNVQSIHHDYLDSIHHSYYLYSLFMRGFERLFQIKHQLLTQSKLLSVLNLPSLMLARIMKYPFSFIIRDSSFMPVGHSVIVVYKKR
jgi:2-polyprenyl-3-methyl-5-hydroxy-6-metoxy-1,4-benzoquinol methylase